MKVSTGADFVNSLLDGGFENDVITTIYGPPGAGKTNFCLLAMAASDPSKKILFSSRSYRPRLSCSSSTDFPK